MRRARLIGLAAAVVVAASTVVPVLAPAVALGAMVIVFRRSRTEPDDAAALVLLGTALLLGMAGFVCFVSVADPRTAVLPNLFFLSSYPFSLSTIVLLARRRSQRRSIGHWLDFAMVAAAFGLLIASFAGKQLVDASSGGGAWVAFVVFAYPVLDVALLAACVLLLAQTGRSGRTMVGFAVGAMAMSLADLAPLLDPYLSFATALATPLATAAYASIGWAALRPLPSAFSSDDTNTTVRALMIPATAGSAALVALLVPDHPVVVTLLAVATVVAAFARIAVAYREVRALDQSRHEARTDELTNMPNRRALRERLEVLTADEKPFALLLVDLDDFKEVNDTLGHEAGDEVLRTIAIRLRRFMAADRSIEVFRLGGDEFAVTVSDPVRLAQRVEAIQRTVLASMAVQGVTINQQVSVGSATHPTDAVTPSDLLRMADRAMYRAKLSRTGYEEWTPGTTSDVSDLKLTPRIRAAIERGLIDLHYQPQVRLRNGGVHGVEALMRMRIDGQVINPMTVVRIAEQISLQHRLTDVVVHKALRQTRTWTDLGLTLHVSVNVSAADISSPGFAGRVRRALDETGARPNLVCLEVTEEALLGDASMVLKTISELRSMGVAIAMDDFGIGFSALTNLRSLELDELKLDRSFVTGLHASPRTQLLVENVVDLGMRLGSRIVAEGIETIDELDAIRTAGIGIGQGYVFAPALPPGDVPAWISEATSERIVEASFRRSSDFVAIADRPPANVPGDSLESAWTPRRSSHR